MTTWPGRPSALVRRTVAATLVLVMLGPGVASACALDNTASFWVDGVRASLNLTPPTDLARWSPFTVDRAFASDTALHLSENRADLARTLSPATLAAPYRWALGDGVTVFGHTITHRYARPGYYRVVVSGDGGTSRGWITFDTVLVHIVTPQEALTANLGYYALRALDIAVPIALWSLEGVLGAGLLYFLLVRPRRRKTVPPAGTDPREPASPEKGTLTHA
ncbi:MAG: hypothetical protein NVSMB65_16500 [Chloroflexota bacterium]